MERWLERIEKVLVYIGILALFLMMCLTTVDAIWRYAFNSPITGAYEVTEKYLMLMAVFLGMSLTYRGGGMIRVAILMDRLPKKVKVPINHLAQLFSISYCAIFIVGTVQYAVRLFHQGTSLGSILWLPLWIGAMVIPVGLLLMAFFMLFDLPRVRKGTSALFRDQEGPTAS
jgi:TRAP-type C4-dicarboxylate transport system permease small subunit